LAKSGSLEVYYCTHNEYVNQNAKVFIVGITPGFQQMSKSIAVARHLIEEDQPVSEILYQCKREARFSGTLRKNIIEMLDELGLHKCLSLNSTSDLFTKKDFMLHTTSLIPYGVFVNGRNYTGHSPKILKNKLLFRFLKECFDPQAAMLKEALVIPLGRSVGEIMRAYVSEGLLKENNILFGFPHPSGANGHRKQQFIANKEKMRDTLMKFYKMDQE
jgi:hypothetical protein